LKVKQFFINMLKGGAIGASMIIPGVSGGTVAVLLNIYNKLIDSIGSLKKDFKNSIAFLLPVACGIVIAFAALYFPLTYALTYAPLPTVLLFVGLMLGSCPKIINDARRGGFKGTDAIAIILPFALVIGMCFIPGMGDVELGEGIVWYQYLLLVIMGVLASCALVVPGISGSMLLMLFGYYQPILDSFKGLFTSPAHYILVLIMFAIGVVVGFFTIAKLMQYLLNKFPRATYWAIVGFVIGSLPAILIVFDYASSPIDGVQIAVGVVLCAIGAVATFLLTLFADKRKAAQSTEA
jgi:putative membrane protein